jgi:predicted membrane-bound spermidine synthase
VAEARPPTVNRARTGTYAGLFMVTMATLMYEIALTRIFSVTMWYHFAFVAISVALFGLTVGALLVYLLPNRFTEARVKRDLWLFSLLFGVAIAVCITLQLWIKFVPRMTLAGMASVVATCVVISVPFVLSGVVVSLALTKFPERVNRLYAADLVGAALGCVVLLLTFSMLDGPSLVVAIGALAAAGALFFAFDLPGRRSIALAGVAVMVLGGIAVANNELHSRGDPLLRVRWAKEQADPTHDYERWNAFSRVTVDGDPDQPVAPFSAGTSPTVPDTFRVPQLSMLIDSTAGTVLTGYDGDPDTTDFLRYDVSNLAHYGRDDADVLVIGVGGGRDVLSALEFEQRSVTGVEINGDILDITNNVFGDFTGHLDRDPRVDFVTDEARSFLARTDDEYDIIQISLIDTWAATSAGAYALSENSLYTTEAWDVFFDSLAPDGILSVTRWYTTPDNDDPLEIFRSTALAAQALKERGAENPRDHILIYRGPPSFHEASLATLMVSPEPLSPDDVAVIDENARRLEFTPVLTPDEAIDERFASLVVPEGPGAEVDRFDANIAPPTDDQPFFFQMQSLDSLVGGENGLGGTQVGQPVVVLAMLAVTVLGLAFVCIVVPLLLTTKRTAHRGMLPFYAYFAGIGLGFLLIEIAQLQRLSVFLGHPTYALSVVLFSVLLFSGIGSMLTERFVRVDRPVSLVTPLLVLLAVVIAFGFLTPRVIEGMDSATTPVRIAVAVALLMPLGLVMGMPFAIGMRSAAARSGAPTAFLWGINGAMSVCASVFGVVIALFFGISISYWVGCAAYVLAAGSIVVITRRATGPAAAAEVAPAERKPDLEQATV